MLVISVKGVECQKFIIEVEYKIFLWLEFDKKFPGDIVVVNSGIIGSIIQNGYLENYITSKSQIKNFVESGDKTSSVQGIDNCKSSIQVSILNIFSSWFQYEMYIESKLTSTKFVKETLFGEIQIKLNSLDEKILEVSKLGEKLTQEQEGKIRERDILFDQLIVDSKKEIEEITKYHLRQKQEELAKEYADIFEQRAEGRLWFNVPFLCTPFYPKEWWRYEFKNGLAPHPVCLRRRHRRWLRPRP